VTAYLVRHTEAGNRERWEGRDEPRPLTDAGWRQAGALVEPLRKAAPVALVSSPYVRCVQSLEPLAEATGLRILEHDALAEEADTGRARELLVAAAALGPVVHSTHGDVQHGVVESLARLGVRLDGPLEFEKASVWEIDVRAGEPVGARYEPPPRS
jgi:8-oxo-dGTP diphosphatase